MKVRIIRVFLTDSYNVINKKFVEMLRDVKPGLNFTVEDLRYTRDLVNKQRCYDLRLSAVTELNLCLEEKNYSYLLYIEALKQYALNKDLKIKII